jgi:hypothetical protein
MARKRRFAVSKEPVDLDKLVPAPKKIVHRVHCPSCTWEFGLVGLPGAELQERCPSCRRIRTYQIPA